MKKIFVLISVFLLAIAISGCSRSGPTKVELVINNNTGKVIDVPVTVSFRYVDSGEEVIACSVDKISKEEKNTETVEKVLQGGTNVFLKVEIDGNYLEQNYTKDSISEIVVNLQVNEVDGNFEITGFAKGEHGLFGKKNDELPKTVVPVNP